MTLPLILHTGKWKAQPAVMHYMTLPNDALCDIIQGNVTNLLELRREMSFLTPTQHHIILSLPQSGNDPSL